jgi:putative ABC transport system substrate-binding protein
MRRRQFITLLGGAVAWPVAARAQQGERMRLIGVLVGGDESDPTRQMWIAEFRAALQKLGWVDGRNIRIDVRWAAADRNRAKAFAADLVALKPDVIFVDNTFIALAMQRTTRSVPIVFARITDPIGNGFVDGLARPGGNMTGFSNAEPSILAKFVEFTKEIAPDVTRVAIIVAAGQWRNPMGKKSLDAIANAASSVGLGSIVVEDEGAREIEDAVVRFGQVPHGGLIVPGDPVTTAHRKLIFAVATHYKLPVIGGNPDLAADGGLLSYGAAAREQYQGAASYVDRILKGEKPADLPVQQPTKYELRVNIRTAKALGLTIPTGLLATAEEIIE